MVGFLIKWTFASIPAMIIVTLLVVAGIALAGLVLGGLSGVFAALMGLGR